MKKTYKVDALNLNDVLVSQKIVAFSANAAAKIVTGKNKYLRIQSIVIIEEPKQAWDEVSEIDHLMGGR